MHGGSIIRILLAISLISAARAFSLGMLGAIRPRNIVRCLFLIRVLKPLPDGGKMGHYLRLHGKRIKT
jgi:hypothetical protein